MEMKMSVTRFEAEDIMTASSFTLFGFGDNISGNATINGVNASEFAAAHSGYNYKFSFGTLIDPYTGYPIGNRDLSKILLQGDSANDLAWTKNNNVDGVWEYSYNEAMPSLSLFKKKQ